MTGPAAPTLPNEALFEWVRGGSGVAQDMKEGSGLFPLPSSVFGRPYSTIFEMGISRMSSAPALFRRGISRLTSDLTATASTAQ